MAGGDNSMNAGLRAAASRIEKTRTGYMLGLVVAVGLLSFAVTFALLWLNPEGIDMRYTVTLGAFIPSALAYLALSRLYSASVLQRLAQELARAAGLSLREDGCFPISIADRHKILPQHNKNRLETGMQGTPPGGLPLAIQETVLTALRQDPQHQKKEKEFLRFWGLVVRIELPRPVSGHSVIVPRAAMKTFYGKDFTQYQEVKTGNPGKFEKIYEVLSTDVVDAKFTVNGSFRDSFLTACRALNVYWAVASFREREVLLAFQCFRPFLWLPPLWKPVTEKALTRYGEEIGALLRLASILKANPQIGG